MVGYKLETSDTPSISLSGIIPLIVLSVIAVILIVLAVLLIIKYRKLSVLIVENQNNNISGHKFNETIGVKV